MILGSDETALLAVLKTFMDLKAEKCLSASKRVSSRREVPHWREGRAGLGRNG